MNSRLKILGVNGSFFLIHDMVVVGTSSDERPGCYLGAATTTHPKRGREKKAALEDEQVWQRPDVWQNASVKSHAKYLIKTLLPFSAQSLFFSLRI